MATDPFFALNDKLNELQLELCRRAWPEDTFERINRATDFRAALWDAICAYRDSYMEKPL
jgi:hypothetical protein